MQQVLQGCEGVHHIMNDSIIHGASKEEHDARLKCVLNKIRDCCLVLIREKCAFNMSELVFMGHVFWRKALDRPRPRSKQ